MVIRTISWMNCFQYFLPELNVAKFLMSPKLWMLIKPLHPTWIGCILTSKLDCLISSSRSKYRITFLLNASVKLVSWHFLSLSPSPSPSLPSSLPPSLSLVSGQMWSARLALLVAMQQYREAEEELSAFGDLMNPDLYYQYHAQNYPGKTGTGSYNRSPDP